MRVNQYDEINTLDNLLYIGVYQQYQTEDMNPILILALKYEIYPLKRCHVKIKSEALLFSMSAATFTNQKNPLTILIN